MSYNKEVAGDNNATDACAGLKDCIKEMCRCMRKNNRWSIERGCIKCYIRGICLEMSVM